MRFSYFTSQIYILSKKIVTEKNYSTINNKYIFLLPVHTFTKMYKNILLQIEIY